MGFIIDQYQVELQKVDRRFKHTRRRIAREGREAEREHRNRVHLVRIELWAAVAELENQYGE